jgi:hypothetical protein
MLNVRCLECGTAYLKPMNGSISVVNPGCPRCGYVGWTPLTAGGQARSVADRRLRPLS